MQNQRLIKQQQQQQQQQHQQAMIQQAMMQQHPSLYHPGVMAPPQMEPLPSGNLPPGFDPTTCRSVYAGNIHTQVTEILLQEIFASTGPIESCKLIRKDKSSYGFVHYFDRRCASMAIMTLNGRHIFGQPMKVNWAYATGQREDTSSHFNIFVGDLSPEVTDAALFDSFSAFNSCSDARVMWDQKTGRSRGFGFVSFRNQQDAQTAINEMNGKWVSSRQIRCNWATKGATFGEDKHSSDGKSVVELTNGSSEDGRELSNEDAPENNPQFTTVYVGNLSPEVTQLDLHRLFYTLGAGVIEEVRVQRDKGFGFVRYNTHDEAALAIQMGNAQPFLFSRQIRCSWGNKPTPSGTASNPLPPPAPASVPSLSAMDLLAYERQLALAKMHPQAQHSLRQAGLGVNVAGGTAAMYDGGYQNVAAAHQQLMYYQ
ncbi:Similar to gb/U55861 RNA binding protein nucleolysin (TIAR) from Mus musculus and contains several PF/00076 RNA recognition motif domains. ESTs gb/T21032 and gb/T44127 come from this gene [Arabidopsis thaliana]|jgi:nucleolysin TIA-1/TIAR|uniref:Oligouridylate-binding protein 1A n=1 Tax=Arabidopsis thaliana TaxID=3702 RepID=UBP1A_ARATH|nr:oligouridylate-binding protein 1A [Arabidopsis thaliana]Q9SYG4.1 RecName: Full=Oligouridylate-binding protein 1A; Short=AtUBP1a; AltName: Full=Polyuridylate-binding protein UBP1A; Short=Poly(U)-binding protein UBP1A [Arabidopsis thaliana]AAD25780.1 Similar to gb/U55861 RNA binding protein nucleolysin (TIAR) from Mus musculus and contains several PF/00076 RNA recognition motif domains. ESTs gb/T21032 and gb/T44127 come from this gene [Arabidopsis thaliana]AAK15558.1 putative oligouridylate bin|eukprot:NP_175810.1 oligouridylate-binding protein 1A [Arabidopsis thaliana]